MLGVNRASSPSSTAPMSLGSTKPECSTFFVSAFTNLICRSSSLTVAIPSDHTRRFLRTSRVYVHSNVRGNAPACFSLLLKGLRPQFCRAPQASVGQSVLSQSEQI